MNHQIYQAEIDRLTREETRLRAEIEESNRIIADLIIQIEGHTKRIAELESIPTYRIVPFDISQEPESNDW